MFLDGLVILFSCFVAELGILPVLWSILAHILKPIEILKLLTILIIHHLFLTFLIQHFLPSKLPVIVIPFFPYLLIQLLHKRIQLVHDLAGFVLIVLAADRRDVVAATVAEEEHRS